MEQMIFIKYITNLYNLECYDDNKLPYRKKFIRNIKILDLQILKNKLAILLNTNEILLYDTKNEKFVKRNFDDENEYEDDIREEYKNSQEENKIKFMKIHSDQIWIISGRFLKLLNPNNLSVLKSFDINENLYSFCFFSEYNNFNFEIVYVNDSNEVKFFSKGLLFDGKYKNLYKENTKIDKILYQSGLLIMSSNLTIKVFDLEKKKMILRKTYEGNQGKTESSDNIIDFILFENFLSVNAGGRMVFVYKMPISVNNIIDIISNSTSVNQSRISQSNYNTYSSSNSKAQSSANEPIEIFRSQDLIDNESRIIGFWLNSSLTKISILKTESESVSINNETQIDSNKEFTSNLNSPYPIKYLTMSIYKFNDCGKNSLNNTSTSNTSSDNFNGNNNPFYGELIHQKNFGHICSHSNFRFSFSQKYSTVYVYDNNEIYFVTLNDRHSKIIQDLKENQNLLNNFNDIYYIFDKLNDLNEKCFIVNKIIRNLKIFLERKTVDQSKLIHLINSFISSNEKVMPQTILLILKTANFEICYKSMSKSVKTKLKNDLKEKILFYFLKTKNFKLMISFISDQNELSISEEFSNAIQEMISSHPNEELYFAYSLLNSKIKNFEKAIEFFLKINKIDQIFQIFKLNPDYVELIFKYENLFEIFKEEQLIEIYELLYEKEKFVENVDVTERFKMCIGFYKSLITNNQEDATNDLEKKISKLPKFFNRIIEKEKFEFLINQEISEICFEVLLKESLNYLNTFTKNNSNISGNSNSNSISQNQNPFYNSLVTLIHKLDSIDFKQILHKNSENLNLIEMLELQILILHKIENYEKIIEVYIDRLRNPEKTISLLENLWNISDVRKEELLDFLKIKIKESNYLTSAKKFYFINLFQDNVSEEHQEIILLEELAQSDNQEDVKFILLILEQLKLKFRILNITCDISKKYLEKMLLVMKKEAKKGKFLRLSSFLRCNYKRCESPNFKKGDDIISFTNCLHLYHKYCFQILNNVLCDKDNTYQNFDVSVSISQEIESGKNESSLFKMSNRCKLCAKVSLD